MKFNRLPSSEIFPNQVFALIGASAVAFFGVAAYKIVDSINNDTKSVINGVGHAISKLAPGQAAQIEAQAALDDVSLSTFRPIVAGNVSAGGSLDTFATWPVFGGKIPGTTDGVSMAETKTVAIMAPKNAVVSQTVHELPGSTTADPKLGATIKVNVDTLYPQILEPNTTLSNNSITSNNHDGLLPKIKYVFFGGAPDGKYTRLLTGVEDNFLRIKCGQAMAPLAQPGIQNNFYLDAQQAELTPTQQVKKNAPQVAQYLKQIGNGSLPVSVELVNSAGQPVSQNFTLEAASKLLSKKAIANLAGVGMDNLDVNPNSTCNSTPKSVEQQVAIQQHYVTHSGESTATANATGVALNG
jgi:hypothetical protein